jgi:HAMP domain-containing protein
MVGIYTSRTITLPLRRLVGALHAFSTGDTEVTLPAPSGDETGALLQAFNRMRA